MQYRREQLNQSSSGTEWEGKKRFRIRIRQDRIDEAGLSKAVHGGRRRANRKVGRGGWAKIKLQHITETNLSHCCSGQST